MEKNGENSFTKPNPNPNLNPSSSSSSSNDPSLCEECGENPWKYRCPGCSIHTCALPCVNAHKVRTGCNGKRSRTHFVPLNQFDESVLLSDYNFLEETRCVSEAAQRVLGEFRGNFGFKLPTRLRLLRNAANQRRIHLLIQSPGMSKRNANRSRYDIRKKTVYWTIEWRFHATDVIFTDHDVDEKMRLSSVIKKHLVPGPWNHSLKPFCDVDVADLKLFLQKDSKCQKSLFHQLDINTPFGQQMANVIIVEYPVIHVFLPSHTLEFEPKDPKLVSNTKDFSTSVDNIHSPKGVVFREEEIEEGEISGEPKVMDLMDYSDLELQEDVVDEVIGPDKEIPKSINELLEADSESNTWTDVMRKNDKQSTSSNVSQVAFPEDGLYDFNQELQDAYMEIVGEINPDDFLCLDGDYSDGLDEERGHCYAKEFLMEEELEEGEILSY